MKLWTINKNNESTVPVADDAPFVSDPVWRREKILKAINSIQAHSRKGLWGILFFLSASVVAFYFRDYGLTSCLSPEIREILGPAPFTVLIDILLAVSTVSSLINIAGRINEGDKPRRTWSHVGFRILFYGLYFISDALSAHVLVVFITGILVLGLEQYALWFYASRTIRNEQQLLGALGQ